MATDEPVAAAGDKQKMEVLSVSVLMCMCALPVLCFCNMGTHDCVDVEYLLFIIFSLHYICVTTTNSIHFRTPHYLLHFIFAIMEDWRTTWQWKNGSTKQDKNMRRISGGICSFLHYGDLGSITTIRCVDKTILYKTCAQWPRLQIKWWQSLLFVTAPNWHRPKDKRTTREQLHFSFSYINKECLNMDFKWLASNI